jgi:hypothetical protein
MRNSKSGRRGAAPGEFASPEALSYDTLAFIHSGFGIHPSLLMPAATAEKDGVCGAIMADQAGSE